MENSLAPPSKQATLKTRTQALTTKGNGLEIIQVQNHKKPKDEYRLKLIHQTQNLHAAIKVTKKIADIVKFNYTSMKLIKKIAKSKGRQYLTIYAAGSSDVSPP